MPTLSKLPIRFAGLLFLCWASSSLSQLDKYLSNTKDGLLLAVAFGGIAAGLLGLRWVYADTQRDVPRWSLAVLWVLIAGAILVLYPIAARHAVGIRGDREDAIRVEIAAILHHRAPYTARTFNGNPATPLPGALLLALPFYATGRIYLQNLLWTGLFFLGTAALFRRRASALFFVFVFILANPGNLDDLAVGGDFFVNLIYVILAVYTVVSAYEKEAPAWFKTLALVFLGVALSSRPIYVVTLPPVLSLVLQRAGKAAALRAVLTVCAVACAVTLPFYLHDLHQLMPAHLSARADLLLPRWLHASLVLPAAGFAAALCSLRFRMNFEAVLLCIGLAMGVMLLPPLVPAFLVPFRGYPAGTNIGLLDLEYLAPAAVPLALWLLRRYELACESGM